MEGTGTETFAENMERTATNVIKMEQVSHHSGSEDGNESSGDMTAVSHGDVSEDGDNFNIKYEPLDSYWPDDNYDSSDENEPLNIPVSFCDMKSETIPDSENMSPFCGKQPPLPLELECDIYDQSIKKDSNITILQKKVIKRPRSHMKEFSCEWCNKVLKCKSALDTHIRTHTGEKPFTCTECERSFAANSDLTKHMRLHSGERPYKCETCDKAFTQATGLNTHRLIHHSGSTERVPKEKTLSCHYCGWLFNKNRSLQDHLRIHTGEKPYPCTDCGKLFARRSYLIAHMKIHSADEGYKCSVCDHIFSQAGRLTTHMRIHTGDKPFFCRECDRSFNRPDILRQHMRTHTAEKPYMCTKCGKTFAKGSNMKRHYDKCKFTPGESEQSDTNTEQSSNLSSSKSAKIEEKHNHEQSENCKLSSAKSTVTQNNMDSVSSQNNIDSVSSQNIMDSSSLQNYMDSVGSEKNMDSVSLYS